MPVKKDFITLLDGRVLCARDAKNAVLDADEAKRICEEVQDELDRLFSRFTAFPTNLDVSVVDRVSLSRSSKSPATISSVRRPGIFPARAQTTTLCATRSVHERSPLTRRIAGHLRPRTSHAWVSANVPPKRRENIDRDAEEGFG